MGHVFQNRFQSEIVETEAYLLGVLRYIHNNPVKANLTVMPEEYNWSSCRAYYRGGDDHDLINISFILDTFAWQQRGGYKAICKFYAEE